ncbi:utrophin isoform X1, partial [Tachysurus ichikawai]
ALAEEMDLQKESLTWLNRNGPQILSSSNLKAHEREAPASRIRQINMTWSKVTQELLEKVREVEAKLQFQERMNHLSDWVHLTQQPLSGRTDLSPSEAQALESAVRERRNELEELLTHSTELHRQQQLLPLEKSKMEQLAADWKVLELRLKERTQVPRSPWTHQITQQPSPVCVEVQRSALLSEAPLSAACVSDRATELADWLQLIQQMLKSSIVTVGDTDEIRTTISRLE